MSKHLDENFKTIFDLSLDILMLVDASGGSILHINRAVHRLLGWDVESVIGKHFTLFFPEETKIDLEKCISYDGVVSEQPFIREDGTVCIMDLTATLIPWPDDRKAVFVTIRDVTERLESEKERERLITELQEAIARVDTLSGLLPICASCKKIRGDEGYWEKVENYFDQHLSIEFTHTICPECAKVLYPESARGKNKKRSG